MMVRISLIILFIAGCGAFNTYAQPVPADRYPAFTESGDTMDVVVLSDIIVFPNIEFKNAKEEQAYLKLVRDVKKTLPYAKMVYMTLIETYEYIQTLPDEKSREVHIKRMEKELFAEYKPVLKKMSLSQGKLLIKLIDRECNQSSYNLVKAFLGPFRAGFWNVFAGMFGASLKTEYDPQGKDAETERVVLLVESGVL
jgi:hypothetical protein